MSEIIFINKKIKKFNKNITVSGDKSLSIRWVLLSLLLMVYQKQKTY